MCSLDVLVGRENAGYAMTSERALEAERDAIVAALTPVVDGLVATFGPLCEVVLHDYRNPEKSVVALAGSVTGRAVGGAMSPPAMSKS